MFHQALELTAVHIPSAFFRTIGAGFLLTDYFWGGGALGVRVLVRGIFFLLQVNGSSSREASTVLRTSVKRGQR